MGERIPYEQAARVARDNPASRLPKRGQPDNRMEPECWPVLRPGVSFDRDTGIFVIGSCFATNVEAYLGDRGYRMLSRAFPDGSALTPGSLNKYTPASIEEAVGWARAIRDRDDRMRPDDAEACFVRLKDGRVIDTQLHAVEPCAEDAALARRADVYSVYRGLFETDLVILTLGLVEAWYDALAGRYIVETPGKALLREKGRFFFERLDYDQCLSHMRRALAAIRGGGAGPQVLLTTSPVVLTRTFTEDDVIVANMYSKSVLRAVAGKLAEEDPRVEYFPSYESVMLTRQNAVWRDDLIHVAEPFIRQIMMRVEREYTGNVSEDYAGALDAASRFVSAVAAHDLAGADAALEAMADPLATEEPEFHTMAAFHAMRRGAREAARAHLDRPASAEAPALAPKHTPLRLMVAGWLDGADGARAMRKRLRAEGGLSLAQIWRTARWLTVEEEPQAAADLLELLGEETITAQRENRWSQMIRILDAAGREALVARLRRARIAARPGETSLSDRVGALAGAAAARLRGDAPTPEAPVLTPEAALRRARAMLSRGNPERARRIGRRMLREHGESETALAAMAEIEAALGGAAPEMRDSGHNDAQSSAHPLAAEGAGRRTAGA